MSENSLFADGGVIGRNPSELGGTWAFCVVVDDVRIAERSGLITPATAELPAITNNLTEMLALVNGLKSLPATWCGTVYSDSQITLGRIFLCWRWKNIPPWLHHEYQMARARLVSWNAIKWTLLQGHPTRKELAEGVGDRGYPVSIHNVWCDQACGDRAREFMQEIGKVTA